MDLVNLDGLTLIGQGSEWFWAMLQMILLVVTFAVIYRQLRAQASANAFQQLEALYGRWHAGLFTQCEVELAVHLKHEGSAPWLWTWTHAEPVLEFFQDVARLNASGHVDLRGIADLRLLFLNWWPLLLPVVRGLRDTWGVAFYADAERLVNVLMQFDDEAGTHSRLARQDWLEGVIETGTARLRRERDWRNGAIPADAAVLAPVRAAPSTGT